MRKALFIFVAILLSAQLFYSCKKDTLTDPNFRLGFSTDTLSFDTVFVTLGSTTNFFTVRNNEDAPVIISSVTLEGGASSKFRMNVDGVSLPDGMINGITIPPKDSIYIFVEVTIDPNGEPLPFLIQDRIVFVTNGNEQDVILQAYGQNAHFLNGEEIETQTWTDDLPYVILNSMLVKECHTLTIREGVEVFFGGNSGMFVAGNIVVEGSKDSLVVFRGVRLDALSDDYSYDDVPGQWSGIFLLRGNGSCIESSIEWAEIRNAQFGISLGSTSLDEFPSASLANGPSLTIENTIIKNHSVFGLYGILSSIEARNLLVHTSGSQLLAFQMGGDYNFEHCTFYNQGSTFNNHQDELLFFSNFFADAGNNLFEERDLERLNFMNCILYGTLLDEIYADSIEESTALLNYQFDHCLLKSRDELTGHVTNCIFNEDPEFFVPEEGDAKDFHLTDISPCVDAGNILTMGTPDLDNTIRDANPDIGAYEFIP